MFTLNLLLVVFSFSEKLNIFELALKARIILRYSYLCTNFFQENLGAKLTFAALLICSDFQLLGYFERAIYALDKTETPLKIWLTRDLVQPKKSAHMEESF